MILVKIGGGNKVNLDMIAKDLATIDEPFLIVHGANALRDELIDRLGVEKEIITSVSGHTSVKSTDELLDVMLMSYAGIRNKRLVEALQKNSIDAVGLTGADGSVIQGRRNRGIRARKNDKRILIRDLSGKPKQINTELLDLLLENDYTPVLTVPIIDENGYLINSENDDIVAQICQQMRIDKVIMLIEEKGLLSDIEEPDSIIEELDHIKLEEWESKVEGRMKRKLYAIRNMLAEDGPTVLIADGRVDNPISQALDHKGTVITW